MDKNKTLIIWLKNGNTCKFEKVKGFHESAEQIEFYYFGVSTRVEREATFQKNNIAGFALEV